MLYTEPAKLEDFEPQIIQNGLRELKKTKPLVVFLEEDIAIVNSFITPARAEMFNIQCYDSKGIVTRCDNLKKILDEKGIKIIRTVV